MQTVVLEVVVRVDLTDACIDHSPVEENKGERGGIQYDYQGQRCDELPLVRVVQVSIGPSNFDTLACDVVDRLWNQQNELYYGEVIEKFAGAKNITVS